MLRRLFLSAAVVTFVASAACSHASSVYSDMRVDGERFGPDQCRNGQKEEFFGVDLRHSGDRKELRVVAHPDKSVSVILMRNDGTAPITFKGCARVSLDRGEPDDQGIYHVSGTATFDCKDDRAEVVGTTRFEDCCDDW